MTSSYIIDSKNNIHSSGGNEYGQLSLGDTNDRDVLTKVPLSIQFREVSCGYSHVAALSICGGLHVCGYNGVGQLGLADDKDYESTLTRLDGLHRFTQFLQVACGYHHTAVLDIHGNLHIAGFSQFTLCHIPTSIPLVQIACGYDYTMGLDINGNLHGYGRNEYGQLGLRDSDNRKELTQLEISTKFSQVSCGYDYTVALDIYGNLYACGCIEHEQVLSNKVESKLKQLSSSIKFKYVSCGSCHTMALTEDGDLYGFGWNIYGQIGMGDIDSMYVLSQVERFVRFSQVSCISDHTLALDLDGNLYGCGNNDCGQLPSIKDSLVKRLTRLHIDLGGGIPKLSNTSMSVEPQVFHNSDEEDDEEENYSKYYCDEREDDE